MDKSIKDNTIKSAVDLRNYLKVKAANHNNHKYYAKKGFIDDILNNHCLYFSDGRNWNDVLDRDSFNSNKTKTMHYGLCLSYSRSESIAMWMLYSGNNGCMIDYDRKLIEDILSANYIALGHFSNSQFQVDKIIDSNFTIIKTDVVYYGPSKNSIKHYYVKRSDETNQSFDKMIINNIARCKKSISWSYENECRIIISVPKTIVPSSATHVKIEFNEAYVDVLNTRTYNSPNTVDCTYQSSALAGKINWDLCKECVEKCNVSSCKNRVTK